jgi:hypothetical protein
MHIVIGVWVLLSPWFLGWSGIPVIMWSNLLAGVLVIILSVWQIFGGEPQGMDKKGHKENNKKTNGS